MVEFKKNDYAFWQQINPKPFAYTEDYTGRQATNDKMSYLRLGMLSGFFTPQEIFAMSMVDVGCGTGCFAENMRRHFKRVETYDLTGGSVDKEGLLSTVWDLIVLSDVLEHMPDLEELFKIQWRHALISFPETPVVSDWRELEGWRHFKPDEHVWMLNISGVCKWLADHNCEVLAASSAEDLIRRPPEGLDTNIASVITRRK